MTSTPVLPDVLGRRLSEDLLPQRPFRWKRELWEPIVHDVPDARSALDELPDQIDRATVRDVVHANLSRDRVLGAFVPVLIWGGPGGAYPVRARARLTGVLSRTNINEPVDETVRDRLLRGAELSRRPDPVEAFRFMNNEGRIKHLGGAFFTKWLAFSSMVGEVDGPEVAPILDKRVSDWIAEYTSDDGQVRLSTSLTRDYRRYLEILDAWGTPSARSRAQVELAIFDLTRDRPASD